MKEKQIGDRIYWEYYDGTIGSGIISDIENASYLDSENHYQVIWFKWYHLNKYSKIESYNCLSDDDPRVQEYIKTNEKYAKFEENLLNWLKMNYYSLNDDIVKQTFQKYS